MGWLLGNLALLSVIGVVCALWWLYGALMWALGLPPDHHPAINTLAAVACLTGGYYYAVTLIRLIRRWEYARARKSRAISP